MDYTFGPFTLSLLRLQLLNGETPVQLEPQVFALLQLLVENHDRVVTRDEIFEIVWKGKAVSDAALSSRIKVARAAIGDSGGEQRFIRTVHGRGFQFTGTVNVLKDADVVRAGAPALPSRPGLAIMPMQMLNPDDGQSDFGTGLADDVITALGRIQALYIVPVPEQADPRRIAKDLGVRYILGMRMRFSGAAYRMNAMLLDADGMEEVWASRFSGTIADDPFITQDQLTASVMGALVPNVLMVEVRQAAERDGKVSETYRDFLRAIPLCWTALADENKQAIDLLRTALERDPDYALSHALLAWCLGQQRMYLWTDDADAVSEAVRHHVRRALRISPDNSLVLTFVSNAETAIGENASAEHHIAKALEIDPYSAWAWCRVGFIRIFDGEGERAREAFEKALALSPHDPLRHSIYFGLGASYFASDDHQMALRWLERALVEHPEKVSVHRLLAAASAAAGDQARAKRSVAALREVMPDITAEELVRSTPIKNAAFREKVLSAYKKAGF